MRHNSSSRSLALAVTAACLFTSKCVLANIAPYAHTQTATLITATNAMLTGMVQPNGAITVAWFEWGLRGDYSQATELVDVGDGQQVIRASVGIADLIEGATYQFRLVSSNAAGIRLGAVAWFTTGSKIAAWGDNTYDQLSGTPSFSNCVAVASGSFHSVALRDDGTVFAWGQNSVGQASVPAGLSNVVSVACGSIHSLAMQADGTVVGWGHNSYGQTSTPAGLSNVIAIACGNGHSLALTSGGTVVGWGFNPYGQAEVPAGLSNVVAIAAAENQSLALKADGTVVAWGENEWGQADVPEGLTNVVNIASVRYKGIALLEDQTISIWGGFTPGGPGLPGGTGGVVAVDGGTTTSFLTLTHDTSAQEWGYNVESEFGLRKSVSNVLAIAAGTFHFLALGDVPPEAEEKLSVGPANRDQVIILSGSDLNGDTLRFLIKDLPDAGTLYQYVDGVRGAPISVPNTLVEDPGGRVIFAPAVNGFDSPYTTFGYVANDGNSDSTTALVTVHVQQTRVLTQPATETRPDRAVLNGVVVPNSFDSTAWFEWGERAEFTFTTTPMAVGEDYQLVRVSATVSNLVTESTYQHRLVVSNANGLAHGPIRLFTTGDRIRAWGNNFAGKASVPASLTHAVAVAAGDLHSLAIRPDGTVAAWGYNSDGQTNVPAGLSNVVAVAGGANHSLALRADGTVVAWGAGGPGQSGSSHYGQSVVPAGLSNVVAVAAGSLYDSLALRSDGTVVAWGYGGNGQKVIPEGLSNVVAIAAGRYHHLAVRADGTVAGWGSSQHAPVPLQVHNVAAVDAGYLHSVGLGTDGTVVTWGMHDSETTFPNNLAPTPEGLTNVVAVASGNRYTMAMQVDGTVMTWGVDYPPPPPGLLGCAGMAAGGTHSLALGGVVMPYAFPQEAHGWVNTDLHVTLAGTGLEGATANLEVHSLPTAGALYQYDSGIRGVMIAEPGMAISDEEGRVVFAPGTNEWGSPYASFEFVATDGGLQSEPAAVKVHLILPSEPVIESSLCEWNEGGSFNLVFYGQEQAPYNVWASTNLVDWLLLGSAAEVEYEAGRYEFIDESAQDWPLRFYRPGTP